MKRFLLSVLRRLTGPVKSPARTSRVRPTVEALDDRNLCSAVGTSLADPASMPVKTEQASLLGVVVHMPQTICARLPPIGSI